MNSSILVLKILLRLSIYGNQETYPLKGKSNKKSNPTINPISVLNDIVYTY